jgi:hypothetical protein
MTVARKEYRFGDCLAIILLIIRGGVGPVKVVTYNLQMSENWDPCSQKYERVPRTNRALLANCAYSLWLRAQQRPSLSPMSGRQAQRHTGVVSE